MPSAKRATEVATAFLGAFGIAALIQAALIQALPRPLPQPRDAGGHVFLNISHSCSLGISIGDQ